MSSQHKRQEYQTMTEVSNELKVCTHRRKEHLSTTKSLYRRLAEIHTDGEFWRNIMS